MAPNKGGFIGGCLDLVRKRKRGFPEWIESTCRWEHERSGWWERGQRGRALKETTGKGTHFRSGKILAQGDLPGIYKCDLTLRLLAIAEASPELAICCSQAGA